MAGKSHKYTIALSDEEYTELTTIRKSNVSLTVQKRCQIILDLDTNHGKAMTYEQTAKSNVVCRATVFNVKKLYATSGIQALVSLKRSENSDQANRKMDGRAEAEIIALACGPAPDGHARWTLRLLEEKCKIELETPVSKETIRKVLKKTN